MGKIDSKGHLRGSVGPVSYRAYNGKSFVQTKPGKGKMKQTAATQNSASDFGHASSLAKAIRKALFPVLQNHSDTAFYRRFAAKIHTATQDGNPQPKGSRLLLDGNLARLQQLDGNNNSPFANYCSLTPTITMSDARQLTIAIPEFSVPEHIAGKSDASDAELVFLVTAINPLTNTETQAELFRLAFPLRDSWIPMQAYTTAVLPEGQLIVVATAVFYYRKNNLAGLVPLNDKACHPCEVTAVLK